MRSGVSLEADNSQVRALAGDQHRWRSARSTTPCSSARRRTSKNVSAGSGSWSASTTGSLPCSARSVGRTPTTSRSTLPLPRSRTSPDPAVLELIREQNRYDIELYRWANERMDRMIAEDPGFAAATGALPAAESALPGVGSSQLHPAQEGSRPGRRGLQVEGFERGESRLAVRIALATVRGAPAEPFVGARLSLILAAASRQAAGSSAGTITPVSSSSTPSGRAPRSLEITAHAARIGLERHAGHRCFLPARGDHDRSCRPDQRRHLLRRHVAEETHPGRRHRVQLGLRRSAADDRERAETLGLVGDLARPRAGCRLPSPASAVRGTRTPRRDHRERARGGAKFGLTTMRPGAKPTRSYVSRMKPLTAANRSTASNDESDRCRVSDVAIVALPAVESR